MEKYEGKHSAETAKKGRSPLGMICAAVVVAVAAGFLLLVWRTGLVPGKWMAVLGGAVGGVALVAAALLCSAGKKVRFALGAVLGAVLTAVLVLGGVMLQQGVAALDRITSAEGEIEYIGVYVMQADQAQELADAKDYTFGILSVMDAALAEKAEATLNEALDTRIDTVGYNTLPGLLDAIYGGEVEAIILPDAFFDLLADMDGYTDAEERLRALITLDFQVDTGDLEKPVMPGDTFAVYISGIDSRSGLLARSRSDVNILAYVNTKTRQVLLVTTPRDYYVPLSISGGVRDKLTHAGIYGVDVSRDTIGMLYDIPIEYYFRVNFEGFEEIIDALGGITVDSALEFTATGKSGGYFHYNKGLNELDGEMALVFARERHAFTDGDRQRGRNQVAVVRGVINKVLSPEILARYTDVLAAVEGNFETTVPYDLAASLVRNQLDKGGDWEIITYDVGGTGDYQVPYSMSMTVYVMWPDQDSVQTVKDMIGQMQRNQRISQP